MPDSTEAEVAFASRPCGGHPCLHIVEEAVVTNGAMPEKVNHLGPAHAREELVQILHGPDWRKKHGLEYFSISQWICCCR